VNDAAWIADLLAHGLISASFVPPKPIQELRDLMRTRKQLVREVSQHSLRIQKTLEDANIKLGSVLSDDPERLADLARGNARKKRAELIQALHGRINAHHRRLLKLHLGLIDALQQALATVDADVGKTLAPIQECARLLTTMPGVNDLTAHAVVAEIGVDMARFPTAGHLLSWATMCPRNDESAGKRRSTRTRKGAPWLKTALVTAAWAAVRVKGSYLQAQFLRLKARRGTKKAILAVAASMLNAAWHMLKDRVEYKDLGADHFARRDRSKAIQRLVRRLNDLGCKVELTADAA
jgi:transposase